ncbi:MAG: DUF3604 domain-containing protein [Planctomycetes bacterium]|nr:DUF3604 domain-containing protein [Planctomycetota bacterium]MBL7037136.1 DUF3604 domain-containing protein [Pirellulaceae bacterium]
MHDHSSTWRKACVRVLVSCLVVFVVPIAQSAELRGLVPNYYEDAAVARGEELGIGTATLDGPEAVEVLSHQTWKLVYTAGKAGMKPGGGIRVGLRHLSQWSVPQTKDPKAIGYFTARAAGHQPAKIAVDFRSRFFGQYFAWQHMVEVLLPERGLRPGEKLELVYGDTSGGSPGMRVQPVDETCFIFKTYVDSLGDGDFLLLRKSPSIEVVAAEPYRVIVVMPSNAVAGEPTWCLVRAEDRYGNPAARYRGTVRFTSTDTSAKLPAAYTFTESDRGVHRFENAVFGALGDHSITATDGEFQATGNPVRVDNKRPKQLLLWGDLHGHTLFSDGRGTVEEFYDFAENVVGLDFCAVTDHAFEIPDEMWEHSKKVTNRAYRPGRFVTFQAYEWSGITPLGGDHNCFFLDDDPPIYRSTSYYTPENLQMYHGPTPKQEHVTDVFAELKKHLQDRNVLCIPHFGGRRGNPQWHDMEVQRMIEIFSEHRRSEDWATTFLTKGHRLGIIASTDNHYGNPGYGYLRPKNDWDHQEIGMAAVAVYAPERTRESIFRALYNRQVYATSGDRIILNFCVDGHPMGTEYRTASPPELVVEAVGTSPVALVELKKDSKVVATFTPKQTSIKLHWRDAEFKADDSCYYYVRILQDDNEEAISSPVWVN